MSDLTVTHDIGDRLVVTVRSHAVVTDQALDDGGTDTGPSPTELFVAGLAACVAFYARRYLHRHRLPEDPLAVTATWQFGQSPTRVARIALEVQIPDGVPPERAAALLAVASHCTVHNTLQVPPDVSIRLAEPPAAVA